MAQTNVKQQLLYVTNQDGKTLAIQGMINKGINIPMLIFVQSKERAMQLHDQLQVENVRAQAIHSDMSSKERDEIVMKFRSGKVSNMVILDIFDYCLFSLLRVSLFYRGYPVSFLIQY